MTETLFAPVPGPLRSLVFAMARRSVVKSLHGQGLGRLPRSEITAIGRQDIDALDGYLGDKPYFGGEKASDIDAAAFAFTAAILKPKLVSPLRDYAIGKTNLTTYCDRMLSEVFPDYLTD